MFDEVSEVESRTPKFSPVGASRKNISLFDPSVVGKTSIRRRATKCWATGGRMLRGYIFYSSILPSFLSLKQISVYFSALPGKIIQLEAENLLLFIHEVDRIERVVNGYPASPLVKISIWGKIPASWATFPARTHFFIDE